MIVLSKINKKGGDQRADDRGVVRDEIGREKFQTPTMMPAKARMILVAPLSKNALNLPKTSLDWGKVFSKRA